jgi:selenocysteine lyase/cysteine desulfurase
MDWTRKVKPISSVRPSLAFYNTREEIDALVLAIRSLQRS